MGPPVMTVTRLGDKCHLLPVLLGSGPFRRLYSLTRLHHSTGRLRARFSIVMSLDVAPRAWCAGSRTSKERKEAMKHSCRLVIALLLVAMATGDRVGAQAAVFNGVVGSGAAWDRFVQRLRDRLSAESIPDDTEVIEPVSSEIPSFFPEGEADSREMLAHAIVSMLQAVAPDTLPTGFSVGDRDPRLFDAAQTSPSGNEKRGASGFEKSVLRAFADAQHALVLLLQTDGNAREATESLAQATDHLVDARARSSVSADVTFATRIAERLAKVSELLAREAIAHAEAAGVEARILTEAELALSRSLTAVIDGRYGDAIRERLIAVDTGDIPILDLDRFAQKIVDSLNGKTVGFSFAIASGGAVARAGAGGFARMPADGQFPQSPFKEMNIASTTKTITAMTVLQLLHEKGVSVDAPVLPWLPASWAKGPGIEYLTFRDLLLHFSGLDQNRGEQSTKYSFLRQVVANGIDPIDTAFWKYQNLNYGMLRVIIPFLHHGPAVMNELDKAIGNLHDITALLYRDIVRVRVLDKTGFAQGDCKPSEVGISQTLMYEFPYFFGHGFADGNWISRCGGGGWYLSAIEMAGILATRRHTNQILTPDVRQLMDEGFLGWYPQYGRKAISRAHNGGLDYGGGRGLGTCWMDYPAGVQAVVFSNSIGIHDDLCSVLLNSYDNSFVDPPGPFFPKSSGKEKP